MYFKLLTILNENDLCSNYEAYGTHLSVFWFRTQKHLRRWWYTVAARDGGSKCRRLVYRTNDVRSDLGLDALEIDVPTFATLFLPRHVDKRPLHVVVDY